MRPSFDFRKALEERIPLLFDGALGTELIARGLSRGECPELWNLERPDELRAVARAYGEAGADVVTSNTFGASSVKLASYGAEDRAEEIARSGASLVREGLGDRGLVAGSMGPTGCFLAPLGPLERDEAFRVFSRQAAALAEGGADLILIETMTALEEARVALEAAKDATSLPVGVTMTFDETPRGWFTIMGVSPEEAARELSEADFLGTNCGNGMAGIIAIIEELTRHTKRPLLASANAGVPRLVDGEARYPEGPEDMAKDFERLRSAGATFIGGCCGTHPGTIAAFRRCLNGRDSS